MISILLRLIAAHVIGDYLLQPDKLCKAKRQPGCDGILAQIVHALVQAVLAYLFVAQWGCWLLPVLVGCTHFLIDWLKLKYMPNGVLGYVIDQCAHIIALIFIWYILFSQNFAINYISLLLSNPKIWAALIAYLVVFEPTSILLSLFLSKWTPENPEEKGLPLGGKYIGYLERFLIVTFVLTNTIEAVGFLLAAKSVFRFGELIKPNEVRTTEYVMIGTLSSFTIAIMAGYFVVIF